MWFMLLLIILFTSKLLAQLNISKHIEFNKQVFKSSPFFSVFLQKHKSITYIRTPCFFSLFIRSSHWEMLSKNWCSSSLCGQKPWKVFVKEFILMLNCKLPQRYFLMVLTTRAGYFFHRCLSYIFWTECSSRLSAHLVQGQL